ncbi:MAG TPA: methylmalonyl Co-A mutase-associated GTPase MeaB [Longimicrobiales bacterium]|nr:methylmalonyl Co-A mutase-associated GTPase MeaB [Longimicrobiales bacterium]
MRDDVSREIRLSNRQRELLARFEAGERAALARLISMVENEREAAAALLDALHPRLGRAHRIGITGPPGAGKSTMTAALVAGYRRAGEQVAVIAVDPTSPFTGGALLGDRIRMNELATDPGVFIRSMASRGALGGLALATKEVADVLDAFGFDRILIETVGVGQSELDIAAAADTTIVVLVPESGDAIQAMKAGLMEIADLYVVNKADRPGAQRLAKEIEVMLNLRTGRYLRNLPAHHGVDLSRMGRSAERRVRGVDPDATGRRADVSAARSPAGPVDGDRAAGGQPGTAAGPEPQPGAPAEMGSTGASQPAAEPWNPPVLLTVASEGKGVDEVIDAVSRHRAWLEASGELIRRRRARLAERVRGVVARELNRITWTEKAGAEILDASLDALESGEVTPYEVAVRIVRAAVG